MKVRGLFFANLGIAAAMAGFGLWVAAGLEQGAVLRDNQDENRATI